MGKERSEIRAFAGGSQRIVIQWVFSFVWFLGLAASTGFAATSDCRGTSVDGQAECILPTYSPTQYSVCDIAGAYLYRANAWAACSTEMGISGSILTEDLAVAYANCFDKKLVPSGGGVTGSVPWKPAGTYYNDNLCYGGTVHVVNGHTLWGIGNKAGSSSNFAFLRSEQVSCPAGYSNVSKTINGISEVVACKPNSTCGPDQVWWGAPKNACVNKVVTLSASKPSRSCQPTSVGASLSSQKSTELNDGKNPGVGDPIFPLRGTMSEVLGTGLSLNGFELLLTYDTTRALYGRNLNALPSLGRLWSTNFHKNLVIGSGAGVITAYRGGKGVVTFTLKNGAYVADADVEDQLVVSNGRYFYYDQRGGALETYAGTGQLTLIEGVDGSVLSFAYSTGKSAKAPDAGYLTRVTDKSGRYIEFEYFAPPATLDYQMGTAGLISKISTSGSITLVPTYDTNFNLVAIAWSDGTAVQYKYDNAQLPWAMTSKMDQNGDVHAFWAYDQNGLAVSTSLANGADSYVVSYDTPPQFGLAADELDLNLNYVYQRYVVAPPTGVRIQAANGSTYSWSSTGVDGAAAFTGANQPAGSGCGAASSSVVYDASGRVASSNDFQDKKTCFAYDAKNREVSRVEGLDAATDCSSLMSANATLPQGARRVLTEWHPDWNLITKRTIPGKIVEYIRQGQVNATTSLVESCSTVPMMADGKPMPLLCKELVSFDGGAAMVVNQYTYDEAANALTIRDASDRLTQLSYSPGERGANDPNFAQVALLLHGNGAEGSNAFVDSSQPPKTVSIGYGAPVQSTAQSLAGPASMYFPGNASLKVIGVDGVGFWSSDWTLEFAVLPAVPTQGRASVFGNRDNSGSGMGGGEVGLYFSSGLLTSFDVSLGESGQWMGFGVSTATPGFTQARAGVGTFNRIAITKQGLAYSFFLNGVMLQSTTRPNAPMTPPSSNLYIGAANQNGFYPYYFNGYIDDFRITLGVARYIKNYVPRTSEFPDQGFAAGADAYPNNLQSVTDAAGRVSTFDLYDRMGRVLQSTDAKGIVTQNTYTARGQVATTTVSAPGQNARVTSYTYDAVGQLTGVSNPDGTSQRYSYDAAHRLTGVSDGQGNSILYTLDASGKRIAEEIKDPSGVLQRSIQRSFDALGRLQQVTGATQ